MKFEPLSPDPSLNKIYIAIHQCTTDRTDVKCQLNQMWAGNWIFTFSIFLHILTPKSQTNIVNHFYLPLPNQFLPPAYHIPLYPLKIQEPIWCFIDLSAQVPKGTLVFAVAGIPRYLNKWVVPLDYWEISSPLSSKVDPIPLLVASHGLSIRPRLLSSRGP
jgi:hypothetical protein